jgi:hypothetical protein
MDFSFPLAGVPLKAIVASVGQRKHGMATPDNT